MTFKEQCRIAGVNYHRALKRKQAGMTNDKIFKDEYLRYTRVTKYSITINGVDYPNIKEACRIIKPAASPKTLRRWIDGGMSPEEAFLKIPNPGYAKGIIYKITQISTGKLYVGLTVLNLSDRWKYHLQQAFSGKTKSNFSLHHAIINSGPRDFKIEQIDVGIAKSNVEAKEVFWIKKLNTVFPSGFNLNTGGSSGGSEKIPTLVDNIKFESRKAAAVYISKTRNISIHAAEKRIDTNRIDVRTPAKKGESKVKTKEYRVWSALKGMGNPKSKSYIQDLSVHAPWCSSFSAWLKEFGLAPTPNHRFCRKNKNLGFIPENCAWMTPKEDALTRLK